MKKTVIVSLMMLLLALPVFAQDDVVVEVRMDTSELIVGEEVVADVFVRDGMDIAGADIAIGVGTCLQVEGMLPGDYLPTTAETGGFTPMNTFDGASARLAANVTGRQFIASGSGVFMSILMRVTCADQPATINITRAELVNGEGLQFTAATTPFTIALSEGTVVDQVANALTTSSTSGDADPVLFGAIGLMLFGLIGFILLVLWQIIRNQRRLASQ